MSTGMRYKSKLVNPGEAAGTRGRSAPRPGASLPPHRVSFSLPAAAPRRGHPALAAPPRRGEAGRWLPWESRGCGSYLGTGRLGCSHAGNRRFACRIPPGLAWVSFLSLPLGVSSGFGWRKAARGWQRRLGIGSTSRIPLPSAAQMRRHSPAPAAPRCCSPSAPRRRPAFGC